MAGLKDSKKLYWGLIVTFFILYACVGFVSTLHSITFFELANTMWLAVLLGITYEVGQATVLFSILMSKNRQNLLPWSLMILLTALQVTANVYASFKFMDSSGSMDWQYWQRSILFWLEADGPEMFKVIISWISGALLPVVALGMTALVAENLKHKDEEAEEAKQHIIESKKEEKLEIPGATKEPTVIINDIAYNEDHLEKIKNEFKKTDFETIKPQFIVDIPNQVSEGSGGDTGELDGYLLDNKLKAEEKELKDSALKFQEKEKLEKQLEKESKLIYADDLNLIPIDSSNRSDKSNIEIKSNDIFEKPSDKSINIKLNGEDISELIDLYSEKMINEPYKEGDKTSNRTEKFEKIPINNKRGWHLKKQFIDTNGDIYQYGEFQPNITIVPPETVIREEDLKKA